MKITADENVDLGIIIRSGDKKLILGAKQTWIES